MPFVNTDYSKISIFQLLDHLLIDPRSPNQSLHKQETMKTQSFTEMAGEITNNTFRIIKFSVYIAYWWLVVGS